MYVLQHLSNNGNKILIFVVSYVKLECLQHEVVPRFLSEKLLEQNRLKNIPPLTANQQFLIARLVWYQDGYEQPSDEDLKRVTQVGFIRLCFILKCTFIISFLILSIHSVSQFSLLQHILSHKFT